MCNLLCTSQPQQMNVVTALNGEKGSLCDSCGGWGIRVHFFLSQTVWRMSVCVDDHHLSTPILACTWIMWIWRGLLSALGAVGVIFHSAATTARHELEECFYQIKTEMLRRLSCDAWYSSYFLLPSFSQRVLLLCFFTYMGLLYLENESASFLFF